MENSYLIELLLEENRSDQELEITKRYWKVIDGVFNESPSKIGLDYQLNTASLSRIAKKNGYLRITRECSICRQRTTLKAHSQTEGKRYLHPLWECHECEEEQLLIEKNRLQEIEDQILETRIKKLDKSIANKSWTAFNKKELLCLLQMLKAKSAQELIAGITKLNDRSYWSIIHKANEHGLVDLIKIDGYYITDYFYHEAIAKHIKEYLNTLESDTNLLKKSTLVHPSIGFRMIRNLQIRTSDDALFYGDISFDRDIIIKAGEIYAYSVWPRENGDTWISISPSDNILKSKNIPRSDGPQIIGDIIKKWKI